MGVAKIHKLICSMIQPNSAAMFCLCFGFHVAACSMFQLLSQLLCFMFQVPGFMFQLACFMFHVSADLPAVVFHVSATRFHVPAVVFHVPCFSWSSSCCVSCFSYQVSCSSCCVSCSMFQLLFQLLLLESFDMDLLETASSTLFSLVCCHQPLYETLVNELLAQHANSATYQRLVEAFAALTGNRLELKIDRLNRTRFMQNFDHFLVDVRGFLCVK